MLVAGGSGPGASPCPQHSTVFTNRNMGQRQGLCVSLGSSMSPGIPGDRRGTPQCHPGLGHLCPACRAPSLLSKARPARTHRSPISRMLLRYRWQSCSTCGGGQTEVSRESLPHAAGGAGARAAPTHIGMAIPQNLVQDMAEFPAQDGAAGQREADGVRPEGEGALLVVCAQNDTCQGQGQRHTGCTRWRRGRAGAPPEQAGEGYGVRASPSPAPPGC